MELDLPSNFNLLSIGSNGRKQLAKRLGITVAQLQRFAWAATCQGYRRAFFGHSDKREGRVATIIRAHGGKVNGIIIQIYHEGNTYYIGNATDKVKINFANLFRKEGINYSLEKIDNVIRYTKTNPRYVPCTDATYAFVGTLQRRPETNGPSSAYVSLIQEMLMDRRELMGKPRNEANKPKIDIVLVG
jgi:hypothetical protein